MSKNTSIRNSMRRARIATEIVISALIVGLGGYGIYNAVNKTTELGSADVSDASDIQIDMTQPVTEAFDPNMTIYENTPVSTKDKFKGALILVNNQHEYLGGNEDLVSINTENKNQDEETFIVGNDFNMKILRCVYQPLISMTRDFNKATNYDDLVVIGGFRTTAKQQELYDADLESTGKDYSTKVAKPGHSEHESGYAMDFTTSTTWDYDGTGKYEWINKNCWQYGFILRYPEDKTEITEIQYEAWHYRYVGVPHAFYMYTNGLCLEEYIDTVREHPYDGEHISFTDGNNNEYEVYFVASDDSSEMTYIPVPSDKKYEISGNNIDGFIVTVYVNEEKAPAEATEPEEPTEEEPSEASTEDEESDDDSDSETTTEEAEEETSQASEN